MGNCWASPVEDNHNSIPSATKPSTPVWGESSAVDRDGEQGLGDQSEEVDAVPMGEIISPKLKVFSYEELKSATRDFGASMVVGEGGFGTVYKCWVDETTYAPSDLRQGIPVAVKKSKPESQQGFYEWEAEVNFLGKFSHPNLIKLLGYCWKDNHFLLVYEYAQEGSLEKHLFKVAEHAKPLQWNTRLKIAIGAARGLTFLHTTEKKVIYRDYKASNILLDRNFNAKLSDFGMAKFGPVYGNSHVTTRIIGTQGYVAPEYIATGHLYVKSDVYCFGVVLLELLTGRKVLDQKRPNIEYDLVGWARPFLPNKKKLKEIMDPRLENQYPSKAAFQTAKLILKCLETDPKIRPSMEEVLEDLLKINVIKMNPKESKARPKHTATSA